MSKISCSDESSCLLTVQGDLYVWGRNTNGMFDSEKGIFAMDAPILRPVLIPGIKVKNMSLGSRSLMLQNYSFSLF